MEITATKDKMGRDVLVISDEMARMLTSHQDEGWREVADVGWGCGRNFPPHHPVTAAARELELVGAGIGNLYALVVGQGDWDPVTRWWIDYLGRRDLHPKHLSTDPAEGTARFSG